MGLFDRNRGEEPAQERNEEQQRAEEPVRREELEQGDGEFLVGDQLSVADITAASLFYPVVVPPEGPLDPDLPRPPALGRFRQSLSERRGYKWVQDTFTKHRHRS